MAGVSPEDLQRAFAVWWEPSYRDLVLEGRLANALPVWGLLGAHPVATVVDPEATPHVTSSADAELAAVLGGSWPHDLVLPALPS